MPADGSRTLPHLPRLDGLRAVAVLLVLVEHLYRSCGSGGWGVTLFFVISGFLITSILLDYPEDMNVWEAARVFYLRRALRLVPVYYVCIAVCLTLDIGGLRQTWWLDALWLTNFRVARAGAWGAATHFWTLSVEEQFYLLWFPVVMLVSRRSILTIIIAMLCIGPLYRLMTLINGWGWYDYLLPGNVDSLASGALLAYVTRLLGKSAMWVQFQRMRPTVMTLIGVSMAYAPFGINPTCLMNLFSLCLVSAAADTRQDWRINWLGGRLIGHLGRISYSLYVVHYFVPQIVHPDWIFHWTTNQELAALVRFVVLSAISVAVAEVSWQLIEKPVNQLKSRIAIRPRELQGHQSTANAGC